MKQKQVHEMSYAAKHRLKEIRREEVRSDITVLRREINKNKFTREDNLRFLEMAQAELAELNKWFRDNK